MKMNAAVYRKYGSPDALSIEQVAQPIPSADELLIRVHASTVNRTDCGFLRGKPFIVRFFSGLRRPKSTILGCEFAGEVIQVGEQVTEFSVGDRVFGFKDDDYGFGGHAEFTTMPEKGMIAKIPSAISYSEAAAATEGAHYALGSIRAAKVKAGQNVLVNGGTGAIGSAAIQLLKNFNATVTAVCAAEHMERVADLGADKVIDYQTQDFTELDETFDLVFDAVGKSTFGRCKCILKLSGTYISTELGPLAQNPFLAIWTAWFGKRKVLFPIPVNLKEDAQFIGDLLEKRKFKPLIDRHYSLTDIVEAYHYVETGMKLGNVIIRITE